MLEVRRIPISEARNNLSELVNLACLNDVRFKITKQDIPLAWLVSNKAYQQGAGINEPRSLHLEALAREAREIRQKSKKLSASTAELLADARSLKDTLYQD
ncbi:type II toxin-antitoxin system Phd/YefM family antitoxin [Patescibacteria group bacterium]|nr:type II toxin-antitoxin system Phd/YefM family antitoxin [Patescibacteria group bacterium]